MRIVRRLIAQRTVAVLVCAAALLLKLLVPTGYMIVSDHERVIITVCPGVATGVHADMARHGKPDGPVKPDLPCVFAGLSAAALGAIDPLQLVALIAFVVAGGLAGILLPGPFRRPYLRPPLRGPPACH